MKQVLHIFAKDVRHQWLEILISLAFVVALAVTSPSRTVAMYGVVSYSPLGMVGNMPDWLVFIIPLSWWLLISPLVHEEKLVGDRQFWITRPYEWKKLLAAKALFLAAFIYLPLLLAPVRDTGAGWLLSIPLPFGTSLQSVSAHLRAGSTIDGFGCRNQKLCANDIGGSGCAGLPGHHSSVVVQPISGPGSNPIRRYHCRRSASRHLSRRGCAAVLSPKRKALVDSARFAGRAAWRLQQGWSAG